MSSLDNEGEKMVEDLRALNIESTLVLDAAIGYIMESIDFVFCGELLNIYLLL
jgi:translation initiation factor eIF-2B subunit alpha